ncbi:Putative glycoside hydrolase family 47, six-hairpin glycosidase-like superfamily [Septoria linicola]|uniref:alpha-1,2-Mannosidase n=1 Tax=Septoria linicola TaxID=215465 RepID=A0A9Q9EPD3_9PEZI|nr:putative glycoside hydrolase family 47, six-hairpin glycosidase-like superfamily [Septoria linicola]USW57554.1 Putative glycoside hydrolase family 47, six-hairpin glycosidase-like superfamily [Septoria linicola]
MNSNRDPFNLRRKSPAAQLFRSTSNSSLHNHETTSHRSATSFLSIDTTNGVQHNTSAIASNNTDNMSGYGIPNGAAAAHSHDNWQSSGRSRFQHGSHIDASTNPGLSEKVGDTIGGMFRDGKKESLPMYKDKPSNFYGPGGRNARQWLRRKRTLGGVLGVFAVLSWWFGILSPLSWFSSGSGDLPAPVQGSLGSGRQQRGWGLWGGKEPVDWDERAQRVKEAFQISWAGYEKYGWGYDEYHPISHTGKFMTQKGLGWIIVDALDTMMIMNLTTELTHAREWIHSNLTYNQDHDVNTFETTIRMLGGLLSAHYLSTQFEGKYAPVDDKLGDDLYVEKATDLADRLLGAYESKSGVPFASVNLAKLQGIPSHADAGASSTAEATTLQLEMKYLAKLTGETHYWEHAENVMRVVDDNQAEDGLVPIFIYADKGTFRGDNIRLGSRGDSYYEYLIKQYLQTSGQEPIYQEMWNETLAGVKKNLITYSSPNNFTVIAERPNGLHKQLEPKQDHLVCFMGGTIALATTGGMSLAQARKQPNWTAKQDEDMRLAHELTKTCVGMYRTPTGLAPEIAHFNMHDPPLMYNDFKPNELPQSPPEFVRCSDEKCSKVVHVVEEDYLFKAADVHNLQRPETIESLFYMWRITGNEQYRIWGWEMFQAFVKYTAVEDGSGFSSISNVLEDPVHFRDNMESFWLAETLKYFYLLFSSDDILPLTDVVFNTEAHPFPKFQLGKLFKTGWQRKKNRSKEESQRLEEQKHKVDEVHDGLQPEVHVVKVIKTMEKEALRETRVAAAPKDGEPGGQVVVGDHKMPGEQEPSDV